MAGGPGKINEYNKALTQAQRKENAKKANAASHKAKREKKSLAEIAQKLLELSLKSKGDEVDVDEVGSLGELAAQNISVKTAMLLALTKNALDGDCKSIDMLLSLTGEKVEKQELTVKSETPLSQTLIYLPDNGRDK